MEEAMNETAPVAEFSRPVQVDRIGREGLTLDLEAGADERAALARRFGLLSLASLTARCRLRPVAGGMIELTGTLTADLEQECVVTLEPVPAHIEESFDTRYALDLARFRAAEAEELIDMEAEDPPEAIDAGTIDLGEAVAQQLAVALDPFPRAPGVVFSGGDTAEAGVDEEQKPSPFAKLKQLKRTK
jgi:uncharacterized metal-binding protein YceD (DUF177 family)